MKKMRMWLISDWESEKLRGISLAARVMYTEQFRRCVDFDTGVYDRRFTTQAWKELLEFTPDRGSTKNTNGLPSEGRGKRFEDWLRARRDELVRAGLIVKQSAYAFKLSVFDAVFLSAKEEHAIEPATNTPKNQPEPALQQGLSDNEAANSSLMNPPPQVLNTTNKLSTPAPEPAKQFLMHESWQPSETFADYAAMSGFDIHNADKDLYQAALADLIMYWITPENQQKHQLYAAKSQQMWCNKLLKDMQYRRNHLHKFKPRIAAKPQPKSNKATQATTAIDLCNTVQQRIDVKNQQACQRQLNALDKQQQRDVLKVFNEMVNQNKVRTTNAILLMNLCKKAKVGTLIVPDDTTPPNANTNNNQAIKLDAEAIRRGETHNDGNGSFELFGDIAKQVTGKSSAEMNADFQMLKTQVTLGFASSIAEAARLMHVEAFYDYAN